MEENDHIEEPHQGQFIDGTPSREVLLRVNNNNDSSIIGDSTSVNPCAQNSLRMILDEIKSLKSQMNLLQNQVKPTSDDKRLTDQNNVRFGINTMYEDNICTTHTSRREPHLCRICTITVIQIIQEQVRHIQRHQEVLLTTGTTNFAQPCIHLKTFEREHTIVMNMMYLTMAT